MTATPEERWEYYKEETGEEPDCLPEDFDTWILHKHLREKMILRRRRIRRRVSKDSPESDYDTNQAERIILTCDEKLKELAKRKKGIDPKPPAPKGRGGLRLFQPSGAKPLRVRGERKL